MSYIDLGDRVLVVHKEHKPYNSVLWTIPHCHSCKSEEQGVLQTIRLGSASLLVRYILCDACLANFIRRNPTYSVSYK